MIQIQQLKLSVGHSEEQLVSAIARSLKLPTAMVGEYHILRKSIDARKKKDIKFVYTIQVSCKNEKQVIKKIKSSNITIKEQKNYKFPPAGTKELKNRPVIVGSGPAGLVCAYMLSIHGYAPILLERGEPVEQRQETVNCFWEKGILNPESNVQFGEGGAGTFSDGKLNTLTKDPSGRNKKVLEIFAEAGAPEEILYLNKPHIGTDMLKGVVRNIRNKIIENGGEVRFNSKMTDLCIENDKICGVLVNGTEKIAADHVVLAIGHSARDTFQMLYDKGVKMKQKSFAVGVRVEHSQKKINLSRYGIESHHHLPNADYKLTKQLNNGRGVYTFCMCPGGYVVNASSENERLAVNGMSYYARDSYNANSAVIVTVTPDDFGDSHPLAGIAFQRDLEEKAYQMGKGSIPVQLYGDFCKNQPSSALGELSPCIKGAYHLANVRDILPDIVGNSIEEGIREFGAMIAGFDDYDTIVSGVESRTSSPVRIERDSAFESNYAGLYPCAEGAGYAGGITSAAMDGIRIAEEIRRNYAPMQ